MSHIDLYAALGLDRSADPAALARELDRRLASSWGADPTQVAQLRTARAILGDASRRVLYDRQLDDPSAPPITAADLDDLAAMPGPDDETSVLPVAGAGQRSVHPQGVPPRGFDQTQDFGGNPYGGQQGYSGNPYAGQPWQQEQSGNPGSRKTVWIVSAAVAAVLIAVVAVGATWFVMRDDDKDGSTTASPLTQQDAPRPETSVPPVETVSPRTTEAVPSSEVPPLDDDFLNDLFGEVSVDRATATSESCGGRDCVRIAIELEGDGEPSILDLYQGDELQIDIFGVDVSYQNDFPVTDRTGGKLSYLRATSDEYDWPRLTVGVPEGTDYTVDNDYLNHLVTVEIYI